MVLDLSDCLAGTVKTEHRVTMDDQVLLDNQEYEDQRVKTAMMEISGSQESKEMRVHKGHQELPGSPD